MTLYLYLQHAAIRYFIRGAPETWLAGDVAHEREFSLIRRVHASLSFDYCDAGTLYRTWLLLSVELKKIGSRIRVEIYE